MIRLEDHAVITARVTILEHDNAYYYTVGGEVRFGKVRIGRWAFIGIGAVILPGVSVGERAIVGALSLVTRDVPDTCVVAGCPAKLIKRLVPEASAAGADAAQSVAPPCVGAL